MSLCITPSANLLPDRSSLRRQEHQLYEAVSSYLMRDDTYGLPSEQKHLIILIVRKVLASSPHAVARTFEVMCNRLLKLKSEAKENANILDFLISDEEIDDDWKMLLEHFDEDVHNRLKVNLASTQAQLDRIGCLFWAVTRHILQDHAHFDDQSFMMRLDDIENANAPTVESYLAKVKVLRKIAHKLIDFLAQLEDFQKKLWLKKKFIIETHYCITPNRMPQALYPLTVNEAQLASMDRVICH
ncbi:hypothetical protein [Candidatus Nitrosoglobus terrae]|nr:hypothetical protein [Candidatus Nitrosoglobus terrae]